MKLPNGEHADAPREKFLEYVLVPTHRYGGPKARLFAAIHGFSASNWAELRDELLRLAATGEAMEGLADQHGKRYTVDGVVTGPKGSHLVRSGWIIRVGTEIPVLVTAFPLVRKEKF